MPEATEYVLYSDILWPIIGAKKFREKAGMTCRSCLEGPSADTTALIANGKMAAEADRNSEKSPQNSKSESRRQGVRSLSKKYGNDLRT